MGFLSKFFPLWTNIGVFARTIPVLARRIAACLSDHACTLRAI
jgi:hypothetical protein